MPDKIHIGKIIKELVKIRRISVFDFAEKINYTPRNVYKIFMKPSIDSALLAKISKVLGQNLFLYYLTDDELSGLKPGSLNEGDLLNSVGNIEAMSLRFKGAKKNKS